MAYGFDPSTLPFAPASAPTNAPAANNQNPPVKPPVRAPKSKAARQKKSSAEVGTLDWLTAGLDKAKQATLGTYAPLMNGRWGDDLINQASLAPGYADRIQSQYQIQLQLAQQAAEDARDAWKMASNADRKKSGFSSPNEAYEATMRSAVSQARQQAGTLISANAGSGKMGTGAAKTANPAAQAALQQATQKWLQPYLGDISDPNLRASAVQSIAAIPAYATIQNQIALGQQQGTQSGYPEFVDPYTQALMNPSSGGGGSSGMSADDLAALFSGGK